AFAVVEAGQEIGPADGGRHRHAVGQALAQDNDIRLQAVSLESEHLSRSTEVGLNFVQDQHDVILLAESLKQGQVAFGRMIGAAASQIRLRDENSELPAVLVPKRLQLLTVGGRIKWLVAQTDIRAFNHRKADKSDAPVALMIRLASGDGAGQALFAVETVTGGNDHFSRWISGQGSPERFLDRFRPRGSPEHLFQAPASRPTLQQLDQATA